MAASSWYVLIGLLLIGIALAGSVMRRLPLTASMFYLALGVVLGPLGWRAFDLDIVEHSALLERLTEIAVIISLFSAGLKLRLPFRDGHWLLPVRLAFVSMALTVGLIAVVGVVGLGLSWGAAVLLGAILAPTDPVLASDVQVANPWDSDRLRFGLTGEAGLNDGTAFPFVMLGLGLLGFHEIGAGAWRWWVVDLAWAVAGGLTIGAVLGLMVGRLVLHLRRRHREAVGLDDFVALGLIALSYGIALAAHAYGFLAVFAAGLALRRVEAAASGAEPSEEIKELAQVGASSEIATDPEKAPAYLAQAVLGFNEQMERIAEVAVVIILGAMLAPEHFTMAALWFVPVLLVAIRPAAVLLVLIGSHSTWTQRAFMSWFGIRGIGSLYYLAFALQHSDPTVLTPTVVGLTLVTVTASIIVHGISVTPLMALYGRIRRRRGGASVPPEQGLQITRVGRA